MENERLEKSCGCIILNEGRALLVQSAKGKHWSFPKGHMETGEDEKATARREVLEETGLKVEICGDFRTTSHYLTKKRIPKEVVYFLARPCHSHVRLQREELQDYSWLPPAEAEKRLTYARDARALSEALRYYDGLKESNR